MVYIFIGIIGFILMYTYDYCNFTNKGNAKKIFGVVSLIAMAVATLGIFWYTPKINIHPYIKFTGLIMSFIWGGFLCYSLFLELPFHNTYGKEEYNSKLVNTGTYALCRHPGVLWFGLLYFSLFLASASMTMLYAGVIWTIIDGIYVYIQEKVFFHKMFPEYGEYVVETPMLVPNGKSFSKFLNTFIKER